jgi:outer membrane protein OmpA-like peptidoglycan-associated protein
MKVTGIKKSGQVVIALLVTVALVFGFKYFYLDAPKEVGQSQLVQKVNLSDMAMPEASLKVDQKLPLPSTKESSKSDLTEVNWTIMAWNSQMPLMYANGGPVTTEGSLFEKNGVKVSIKRQDDCFKTIADFIANTKELKNNPSTVPMLMSFMGDGMPGFSTMLASIEKDLGKEYKPIIIYHMGRSNGEDQFMAPASWKDNPKNSLGKTVAGVELDGDLNIVIKWASDNNIPLNVNTKVFDSTALNVLPAPDFLDAVKKYNSGYTEKRVVVVNGKTTNRQVEVGVDAVTTWTPGDVMVAEGKGGLVTIASTREYSSQMPNATVICKKWAYDHREAVEDIIRSLGEAGDQVRSFPEALSFAGQVSAVVYGEKDANYWVKYYKGVEEKDVTGALVKLGGSMAFNLNDAANVVGLGDDKKDRYRVTYDVFGKSLKQLYPDRMSNYTPYSEIMDKSFLSSVLVNAGENESRGATLKQEYNSEITSTVSSKSYAIEFDNGSDVITKSSQSELEKIFESATIAEGLKVGVYGHTNSTGNEDINQPLSERRASSVKRALIELGVSKDQIETKGFGSQKPLSGIDPTNSLNRRVEIVLGK